MEAISTIKKVSLQIDYKDTDIQDNGSYTLSGIKLDASKDNIYKAALAILSLQEPDDDAMYITVESLITEKQV